jgi:hypothetical protein
MSKIFYIWIINLYYFFEKSVGELLDILIEEGSEYNGKRRHQQHDQAGGCQATAGKT